MQEVEAAYQQVILLGAFVKFCERALSDNIPPPLRAPLTSFAHGREHSHHRVHPHSPASATEKKDAASILLNSGWNSSCERIYARPNIPRKKLAGAIAAYAPNVLPDEVIILLDDTVFGGAREGVLVTQNGIYCKELGGEPGHWRLDAIQTMKPGTDARVMINGREFFKAVLIDHFAVATFVSRLSNLFE